MTTTSTTPAPVTTADAIKAFLDHVAEDPAFEGYLTVSLEAADEQARRDLKPDLYRALAWPRDLRGYVTYLAEFARWIPQQSGDPAWTKPGTDEQQEAYDRLCHFYWLIDQGVGDPPTIVQNIPWFSDWLILYADAWGSFLNTTESFSDEILQSFITFSPLYAVEDSMIDGRPNAPSGWLTFNQFFARELNPGLRPIAAPGDNHTIVSPADCTFQASYPISADSTIPSIVVKKTHTYASVEDLLEGSDYKSAFANGTFAHYFLNTYSYHRFHLPVSGIVRECYPVHGKVYLDVELDKGQFNAPDSAEGGYQFSQARGVVIVDTTGSPYGDIGLVGIVPIGMAQVSSVNMTHTAGAAGLKGDEFGYFLFGGSDIIVLLQDGALVTVDEGKGYRHYGTPIATNPGA